MGAQGRIIYYGTTIERILIVNSYIHNYINKILKTILVCGHLDICLSLDSHHQYLVRETLSYSQRTVPSNCVVICIIFDCFFYKNSHRFSYLHLYSVVLLVFLLWLYWYCICVQLELFWLNVIVEVGSRSIDSKFIALKLQLKAFSPLSHITSDFFQHFQKIKRKKKPIWGRTFQLKALFFFREIH